MNNYSDLLRKIFHEGVASNDRTGVGTVSLFGPQLEWDLSEGFPLVTGKRTNFKAVKEELRWFLSGSTNINDLDSKIWDSWADKDGSVGPVYGHQWRTWGGYRDQIAELIESLKRNPASRRHMVSTWNVEDVPDMGLPCCHVLFQCYVRNNKLSLKMYQRSADMFLGVPFNIASYALLMRLLCHECDLMMGDLIITFGDAHIYADHLKQVIEYLARGRFELPSLRVKSVDFSTGDFNVELEGYEYGGRIAAPVAV